jgi:Caspase domain
MVNLTTLQRLQLTLSALLIVVCGWAVAQAPSGERLALIIGNSAYPSAPLANPQNDARAMTGLLRSAGFDVDQQVDTTLDQLRKAVTTFGERIKDPKVKLAVFYYAGHGVQLDWRNYLVPVTAHIRNADDVRKQTVDVSELVNLMSAAKNRNYLIILDACRDDPFAGNYRAPAQGLSQFDAPSGSVLAYSTSPGKVAFDGEGENGLYTSNLLKEFAVRGIKIEDAFKRTRLNVRMASNGSQVPWETTSLEDDIYLFPDSRKILSEEQQHALFESELQAWSKIKTSTSLPVLADFIRTYPSGSVSELAAARFNRLQAAQRLREEQEAQAAKSAALLAAEQERMRREAALKQAQREALLAKQEADRQAELEVQRQAQIQAQMQAQFAKEQARLQAQKLEAEAARVAAAAAESARIAQAEAKALAQAQEQARIQAQQLAKAQADAAKEALAKAQEHEANELAKNKLMQAATAPASMPSVSIPAVALAPLPMLVAATPYYKGSTEHLRAYAVDDVYEFQVIDSFTKASKPLVMRVTQIDTNNDTVQFNGGEYVSDFMGNILTNLRGSSSTPRQFYPAELVVGKRWRTEFVQNRAGGIRYTFRYDLKVVSKEKVTVPAGTFETYKIEAHGFNMELGASLQRNIWIAPGINADIAHETIVRLKSGRIEQYDRQELVRFVQKLTPQPQPTQVASR